MIFAKRRAGHFFGANGPNGEPGTVTTTQLSVAICTRGRSSTVHDAVASVLADPTEDVRLVLVDQNDDDRVAEALGDLSDDPRLLHVKIDTVGAGRARNVALSLVDSEVVCFTDDDCTVPRGWARELTDLIMSEPAVALVYCNVDEPSGATTNGYTPAHSVSTQKRHTSWDLSARADLLGLGAGMAARRRDLTAIGNFDPLMGPGGQFPSADDREIAVRLLLTGRQVWHTPHPSVMHHGFREDGADARALTKRDHLALGAMHAKFLRTTPSKSALHLAAFLWWSAREAVRTSAAMRRPAGIGKVLWTVVGTWRGLRTPMDRSTLTYLDDSAPALVQSVPTNPSKDATTSQQKLIRS